MEVIAKWGAITSHCTVYVTNLFSRKRRDKKKGLQKDAGLPELQQEANTKEFVTPIFGQDEPVWDYMRAEIEKPFRRYTVEYLELLMEANTTLQFAN